MSPFWIKTFELLLSLSLLIFVHELGHFKWARIFGVRVEKFYLFFNPWFTLFKYKPKNSDTEYGIGWLPLGGYCKIAGMIDESMDTEAMKQPMQPWEFRAKPAWQRLLIMTGGVLNNFIAAIIIYAGMVYHYGEQYLPYQNDELGMAYCEAAHNIGFRDGDIPLRADDKELHYMTSDELLSIMNAKKVLVKRGSDTIAIAIPEKFVFRVEKEAKEGKPFMDYRVPVVVFDVQPGDGAAKAGMRRGDRITRVDSVATPDYSSFTAQLQNYKKKTVNISFLRDGKEMTLPVEINSNARVGIRLMPVDSIFTTIKKEYGLLESIPRGISTGCTTLVNYVKQFKYVFSKEGAESLGGFGAIGSIFPETWNWGAFWNITALLSIILAFMNILPIPALDGGHVLFLLYEIVRGKAPSDKFLERAQVVGMTLLILLLLYANGNDLYRWVIKPFMQ